MKSSLTFPPRRRSIGFAIVGYVIFIAVTVLLSGFAWSYWSSKENLSLILLVVWVIAWTTHGLIRDYWRACKNSALLSAVVYVILVQSMSESNVDGSNTMVGVGMILVGLFGFVLSMGVGPLVAIYRHQDDDQT